MSTTINKFSSGDLAFAKEIVRYFTSSLPYIAPFIKFSNEKRTLNASN
jgi:hypothetical protein